MKKKPLLLLISFVTVTAFGQNIIPEDWKIPTKQANKMIQYFSDCGDCPTSKATSDTAKENLIRAMFTNAKSITWVDARYRPEDATRYASRNWKTARGAGSQVGGYATKIMRVTDADDRVYYFDITSICPPPSICDQVEQPKVIDQ
jgi:hypothetical protein